MLCPLDQIFRYKEGDPIPDFCLTSLEPTSFDKQLGYTGGWIHSSLVKWLLHVRVLKLSQIELGLNASVKLPHDVMATPLRIMEECWGQNACLAKQSVNAAIGMMVRKSTCISCVSDIILITFTFARPACLGR